ncbi:endonuclease III [Miniimonas arenae]|uniref:Endonuclease III n=1 Tax=Miniimonas arenae TaxID=676201 RepID=A0A5C5BED5_9MICO|nr:endonuclease III [Miniimonas arenae]TNU74934.1 endonuclease III [Miniimonas arenae]
MADPAVVNARLALAHPDARCALDHADAFQLLVATVLSAQTTDERVNTVTPEVFGRWPDAAALATADLAALEDVLRPLGFFRAKARSLVGLAQGLVRDHDGEVPPDLDALVALPGVGRKTANLVLGNAFGIPGITVDTHVGRLARRLGWTTQTDPVRAEADIAALVPPSEWVMLCHRLIFHGRRVCHARRPACGECVLADVCPSAFAV